MKRKITAVVITATLLAAAAATMLFARERLADNTRNDTEHRMSAEERAIVVGMHDSIVRLLAHAEANYPVPYVRETLKDFFDSVQSKRAVLASDYTTDTSLDGIWAHYHKAADGRPVITLMLRYIVENVGQLAEKGENGEPQMSDDEFQDWLVFFIVHEWYHRKHAHIGVADPTGEIVQQDESEAWHDGYTNVIIPAKTKGRFGLPMSENAVIGLQCYVKAHSDPAHPAWKSFIAWTTGEQGRPDCS